MGTYNKEIPLKQKLRLADAYIKQLKYEIGVLESEKDELVYKLDESNKEISRLMNKLLQHESLSKSDIKKLKTEQSKSKLQKTIKSLKKDKESLIIKLLKLENNSNQDA